MHTDGTTFGSSSSSCFESELLLPRRLSFCGPDSSRCVARERLALGLLAGCLESSFGGAVLVRLRVALPLGTGSTKGFTVDLPDRKGCVRGAAAASASSLPSAALTA